jgi:CheY-like chemotaxis protein
MRSQPGELRLTNDRALQAGFDHHLVKPVKPDELDRLLTKL